MSGRYSVSFGDNVSVCKLSFCILQVSGFLGLVVVLSAVSFSPFNIIVIMASKSSSSNTTRPCLHLSLEKDQFGLYASVSCGNISGHLYPDRMSKKSPGKCILVGGHWYTPAEVESLGGKKSSRKWILHIGKPLADYDLTL